MLRIRTPGIAALFAASQKESLPGILLAAEVVESKDCQEPGRLITAISAPWFKIVDLIRTDPDAIYKIDPFKWEEIIAGAYEAAGFDEVILTPRSGDLGRDVIATMHGYGRIRIFDQVKAYKPGHRVPAHDVRALLGVINGGQNVSKGVITTTSTFAPGVEKDPYLAPYMPYRLELKGRDELLKWLEAIRSEPTIRSRKSSQQGGELDAATRRQIP